MNPIDAFRPRLSCYRARSCWMQDTGDPGDAACPIGRCGLWASLEDASDVVDVLTSGDPDTDGTRPGTRHE